jgi:hypothetical protein
MVFVEFPNFTKRVTELLDDEDYRRLRLRSSLTRSWVT